MYRDNWCELYWSDWGHLAGVFGHSKPRISTRSKELRSLTRCFTSSLPKKLWSMYARDVDSHKGPDSFKEQNRKMRDTSKQRWKNEATTNILCRWMNVSYDTRLCISSKRILQLGGKNIKMKYQENWKKIPQSTT